MNEDIRVFEFEVIPIARAGNKCPPVPPPEIIIFIRLHIQIGFQPLAWLTLRFA